MTVFKEYAQYYDLFYADKDYRAEARYVAGLIQRFRPGAASILDLGCGTGNHDVIFAADGYRVTGIDRSEQSIAKARGKADRGEPVNPRFEQSSIESLRLGERFDAVVSLFHVMSYLTCYRDLESALETARVHLEDGGIFLFDCWYGPAVLSDPPTVRVKRVSDETVDVVRIAEPEVRINENIVDVHYQVLVHHRDSGKTMNVREMHSMRYWFKPEIDRMLSAAGFDPLDCRQWMSGQAPGARSWNVCFIARKSCGRKR